MDPLGWFAQEPRGRLGWEGTATPARWRMRSWATNRRHRRMLTGYARDDMSGQKFVGRAAVKAGDGLDVLLSVQQPSREIAEDRSGVSY